MNKSSILIAALTLLGASGCGDDWVEFRILTEAPPDTVLQPDQIQIAEGWAVGVEAIPISSNSRVDAVLELVADNPSVIGIDRSLETNHFVIYGVGPGQSGVDIYFDDDLIGDMPANVVAR
jgi:hypothetical protein